MQSWLKGAALGAAIAGVALGAATLTAHSADLYNEYPPANRSGSAYDDPRYADLYGNPPPRPRYDDRYAPPYRPPVEYRDRYPVPSEPIYRDRYPRQYSEARPDYRAYSAGPGCRSKDEISYNLERDGWRDFHDPRVIDQGSAFVKARRYGRMFQIKIDRCSGDIIGARPLDPPRGPYADYERPYRTY